MAPSFPTTRPKCGDPHPLYPNIFYCDELGGYADRTWFGPDASDHWEYALHTEGTTGRMVRLGPARGCTSALRNSEDAS